VLREALIALRLWMQYVPVGGRCSVRGGLLMEDAAAGNAIRAPLRE